MHPLEGVIQMPGICLDNITHRAGGNGTASRANPASSGHGGRFQEKTLKGSRLGSERFL